MNMAYLIPAFLVICMAHLVRALRWGSFIKIYEKPRLGSLSRGIALGYLFGAVLPFKLGDLVRVFYTGKRMKNGRTLALSTVIVDRYLDVIFVGVSFFMLYLFDGGGEVYAKSAFVYAGFCMLTCAVTVLAYLFRKRLKLMVMSFAGIFAPGIEEKILKFSWALILNFKDMARGISKVYLFLITLFMWGLYILSYALFALGMGSSEGWREVFASLFSGGAPAASLLQVAFSGGKTENALLMCLFMVLPALLLYIAASFFRDEQGDDGREYLQLLPHLDGRERLQFLENYFSDKNREYLSVYLKINQNISIIRDYSAGSNATTMLCTDGNSMFFRKYAFSKDADKLYLQVRWIDENREWLNLPEIIGSERGDIYCYYDMPYIGNALGFFEYIHCMPQDEVWNMTKRVLSSISGSIHRRNVRPAGMEEVRGYIGEKVEGNLEKIISAKSLKGLTSCDELWINGLCYKNLGFYREFLSRQSLEQIFSEDPVCVIHGDLTVENIICTRDEGFYLIDPNCGNILDSPMLDLAKLMQSLHGGYEFYTTVRNVSVHDGCHIDFMYTGSKAYDELYGRYDRYLREHYDARSVKSIYFHEVVHWLRLMPYKIEKGEGPLYYAGLLKVLSQVYDMYG